MVNKNPYQAPRPSRGRGASSYQQAQSAKPAPKVRPKKRKPITQQGGFWLGIGLVLLAVILMSARTWISLQEDGSPSLVEKMRAMANQSDTFGNLHKNFKASVSKPAPTAPQSSKAAPELSVFKDVPVRAFNPTFGPASAKLTITVFGSLDCVRCVELLHMAKKAAVANTGQVRVVSKFLGGANPSTAVEAGLYGMVAASRDIYWQVLDDVALRGSGDLVGILESYDIDLNALRRVLETQSDEILAKLEIDVEDASALRLSKAPAVYIGPERVDSAITSAEMLRAVSEGLALR